jgi:phosphatidylglycerol lysyltransferase
LWLTPQSPEVRVTARPTSDTETESEQNGGVPSNPPRNLNPLILVLANARWLWPLLIATIVAAITWPDLRSIDYHKVRQALHGQTTALILAAALLTAANLAVMGFYDVICLRASRVQLRDRWRIGVLAFAWSNFLTLGPVAGPAIRIWLYRPKGVGFVILRRAIVSISIGFSGGLAVWLLVSLAPVGLAGPAGFACRAAAAFGMAALAGVVLGKSLRWRRWPEWVRDLHVFWPPLLMLGTLDWLLAWAVFACLIEAGGAGLNVDAISRLFFLGQGIGLASLIPGGLGTADAFWLARLSGSEGKGAASLILYRAIYYILPWAGATLLLLRRAVQRKVPWATPSRFFISVVVLISGCVILVSAATPALARRIVLLKEVVPLAVLESSHIATGIIGIFLFVLARGLRKGYRAAYRTTLALLLAGAAGSLLKGLDYEEAIVLLLTAVLLWTHSSLFTVPSGPGGTAIAILAPLALALFVFAGVGFTVFASTPLSSSLLLNFAHHGSAARFLRTLSVLMLLTLLIGIYLILRKPHRYTPPSEEELRRAMDMLGRFGKGTNALMMFNRDKSIHFSGDQGFCLYRTTLKYLIVFSDPIVAPFRERAFVRSLLDKAAELDRSLLFYQISSHWIPVLHDFGYSFFKLGEEAILDLDRFNIQGNKGKAMRNVLNRFRNDGYQFEVVQADDIPPLMNELRFVSDEWLRSKKSRERQFSIGFFDETYMSAFPCALVRDKTGRLVAFANILTGPRTEEFSVDLMRYVPECPNGVMDLLFLRLFEWGKGLGYRSFNLGMAPLATVGEARQARPQERLAKLVFQHGEHWYNFRGLRQFKEKFDPVWMPRYLAYPAFWLWPQAIVSVAALIAGGWRSMVLPTLRPGKPGMVSSPQPQDAASGASR